MNDIFKKIIFLAGLFIVGISFLSLSMTLMSASSTFQSFMGLILALGTLIGTAYLGYRVLYKKPPTTPPFEPFIILLVSLPLMTGCAERIDAGHVGVQVDLYGSDKGVQDVTLVTGMVWYNPFTTNVEEVPTYTQTKDYEPFKVNSKDAAEFTVDPTLNYHLQADSVVPVYRQYRRPLHELEEGVMRNMVYDSYRTITNRFTSDSLMANRGIYESLIEKDLRTRLQQYGFVFEQLTSQIVPPPSLKDAIDAKNAMVQAGLQAENQVKQARAQAEIKIATARGVAESQLVIARAEAEAYRLKQQNLTPLLVQQQFLDKWNGTLPTYGEVPQLFLDVMKADRR